MSDLGYRIESDSMGEIKVPNNVLYGAQTQRSLENFNVGNEKMPPQLIRAFGYLKKSAALANCELGQLDKTITDLIVKAADEVISLKLIDEFPLKVWQTGSGTQSHMNVNEVISNRAIQIAGGELGSKKPVHPNDHVNMSQSTNDAFSSAMHIAAVLALTEEVIPALELFAKGLRAKEKEFGDVVKIGRTHLQDAVPISYGQEFSGYTAQIERNIERIKMTLSGLYELVLGGTAVGTGINAHPDFDKKSIGHIAKLTKYPFKVHPNKFAAISAHDEFVFASGALKTTACSMMKIAYDIAWSASGPRCGIGEMHIPENEPGSSIMPGKINPTQSEAMFAVASHVIGNDTAIASAGSRGNFQINAFKPTILYNFIQSCDLISDATRLFTNCCLNGITLNRDKIKQNLDNSLMLVTALSPEIGYDKSSEIAHKANHENLSLKESCMQLGYLSEKEFDEIVVPENMIHPKAKK